MRCVIMLACREPSACATSRTSSTLAEGFRPMKSIARCMTAATDCPLRLHTAASPR